jgi:hypothetical protein
MFKFSIHDLLWLMLVVALGVAWWVDRGRLTVRLDRQAEQIHEMETRWSAWMRGGGPRFPINSEDY